MRQLDMTIAIKIGRTERFPADVEFGRYRTSERTSKITLLQPANNLISH